MEGVDRGRGGLCIQGSSRQVSPERALSHRLARAEALVHLGELSAARQALEGAEVAPGSVETLDALRKRPAMPREVCPPELIRHRPEVLFVRDEDHLHKNLRSAKRGRRSIRDDGGTSPTFA